MNSKNERILKHTNIELLYMNKNFFPVYKRYIVFLKKEVKDHLYKTNNICENYIRKIIDKDRKHDFKIIKGVFDYIINRVEGWIKKHQPKSSSF